MFGINHFDVVDYITVSATILFSVAIGVYYACYGEQTTEEVLVGGRNMQIIPVAISMLVTYFSATAILGTPAEVYAFGSQFYFLIILCIIFIPLSTFIFVKVFYEMKLTSIYEYLEFRFKSKWVRWLTSFAFILQILLLNAITLFAPAIALDAIVGLPTWVSVVGIGVIGTVYTSIGGLKAVIWTDVFQFVMIIIGMGAIVIKGFIKAGGVVKAFEITAQKGRLQVFDWTIDPFMRHNTLNFILGSGFTILSLYGTHQPLVQRYCSLPSTSAAIKTLMWTLPLNVVTYSATFITGISAVATYAGCDPILLGEIERPDAIIPHFVINELSFIPGMMGIFVSCIFSAVLSSVSSTLNSLAAVTWEDYLSSFLYFKNMSPTAQTNWTKVIAALYGALSIGLAFGAQNLGTLFQVVLTAIGATSGPLGGIFLCGLFLPFFNKPGAIVGIVCGLSTMMYLAVQAFLLGMKYVLFPPLPTDLLDCPPGTNFTNARNYTPPVIHEFDYPEKLYTLSYVLYPFVGACITVIIGMLVSACTGGFTRRSVQKRYLHPWIQNAQWVRHYLIDEDCDEKWNNNVPKSNGSFKEKGKQADSQYPYQYELVERISQNGTGNGHYPGIDKK